MSVAGRNSEARSSLGPRRDDGCAFVHRPFILAAWNDGKAGRLGSRPARAKTAQGYCAVEEATVVASMMDGAGGVGGDHCGSGQWGKTASERTEMMSKQPISIQWKGETLGRNQTSAATFSLLPRRWHNLLSANLEDDLK